MDEVIGTVGSSDGRQPQRCRSCRSAHPIGCHGRRGLRFRPVSTDGDALEGSAAARGGALRAGGFLLGQLLTVGAVALLFRHLGVDDTGRYVTVLSLVAIVQGLTD